MARGPKPAERDARVEAEGLCADPIHELIADKLFSTFDEGNPKVEPATPDVDL